MQRDDGVAVAAAADAVTGALQDLAPSSCRTVLLHRGRHPLWEAVDKRLKQAGQSVHRVILAEDDQSWDPVAAVEQASAQVQLLVFHDPFGSGHITADWCETIRTLLGTGVSVAFVDFPHGLRNAGLTAQLQEHYLNALAAPTSHLRRRALALENRLAQAVDLTVITGADELRVSRPWVVSSDWTAVAHQPILQLPAGEVWLSFDPGTVEGDVQVSGIRSGTNVAGRVTAGWLQLDRRIAEPVVELGIGVNDSAAWIPRTTLAEKASGRVHLGFGDNTLLGGHRRAPVHFDFALAHSTEVWGRLDDGSRVRMGTG